MEDNTILVVKADSPALITDTQMALYIYSAGNNFVVPSDSLILSLDTQTRFIGMDLYNDFHATPYGHDYMVAFKPSGKNYKITGIRHDDRSIKVNTEDYNDIYCSDNIFYAVNGQVQVCPGSETDGSGVENLLQVHY